MKNDPTALATHAIIGVACDLWNNVPKLNASIRSEGKYVPYSPRFGTSTELFDDLKKNSKSQRQTPKTFSLDK